MPHMDVPLQKECLVDADRLRALVVAIRRELPETELPQRLQELAGHFAGIPVLGMILKPSPSRRHAGIDHGLRLS